MKFSVRNVKRNLAKILVCVMTFSMTQGVYADELGSSETTSDAVSTEDVVGDLDSSTDTDPMEGEDSGNDESQLDSDSSTDTDSIEGEGSGNDESSSEEDNPTDADTTEGEDSGNDEPITGSGSSTETTTDTNSDDLLEPTTESVAEVVPEDNGSSSSGSGGSTESTTEAVTEAVTETDSNQETKNPDDTDTDIADEEVSQTEFKYELDSNVAVTVTLSEGTILPKDSELQVKPLTSSETDEVLSTVRTALELNNNNELYFLPYDIYFTDDNGEKIEPAGDMTVTIKYSEDPFADLATGKKTEFFAVHIKDDGTVEKLNMTRKYIDAGVEFTFIVSSFSLMGPAMAISEPVTVPELDGEYSDVYVPTAPSDMAGAVSFKTLDSAFDNLSNDGTVWLTDDITMDTIMFSGSSAKIRSYDEAHTLTKSGGSENMFALSDGASLTLENVIIDASANIKGRTITAVDNSTLTLGTDAALKNNTTHGAVYLDASSILIDGGVISDNAAVDNASTKVWPANSTWSADTIYHVFDSRYGGNQGLGGAVLMVNDSSFSLSSGEISGNIALQGGAVYACAGSNISLNGGVISDNTATTTECSAAGGAICVDNGSCRVDMDGTEVRGNSAAKGGGFFFGLDVSSLDFVMTSGKLTDNSAAGDGSAIYSIAADGLIDISGDNSFIENNIATGNGGIYIGMYPTNPKSNRANVSIRDGATFNGNHAAKGSCLYVTRDKGANGLTLDGAIFMNNETTNDAGVIQYNIPESEFIVTNCRFENNRAENRGGCFYSAVDAKNSTFKFENSVFTGNSARIEGGVWRGCPPDSDFIIEGCTFEENSCGFEKDGSDVPNQSSGGGCFYFPSDGVNTSITFDGGVFRHNKSGASGGAFMARLNSATVVVKGGTLFEENEADVNAGAFSIKRKGEGYSGTAYLIECDVINNVCNADYTHCVEEDVEATMHYNTGGVYVGESITLHMYNAIVTKNYVEDGYTGNMVGSGIGACPNAEIYLFPDNGSMIFDNGDANTMDILAVPYDPAIKHETPAKLYVSDVTPDGRAYNWTNLDGDEARTGTYDWTNIYNGAVMAAALDDSYHGETTFNPVGFKANVTDAGIMRTALDDDSEEYKVRIIDNHTKAATYAAGGVMVNGTVISGDFEISVEKKTEGLTETEKKTKDFKFSLSIAGVSENLIANATKFLADGSKTELPAVNFTVSGDKIVENQFTLKSDEKIIFTNFRTSSNSNPFGSGGGYSGKDLTFTLTELDNNGALFSHVGWMTYDEDGNELSGDDFSVKSEPAKQIKTLKFVCTNVFSGYNSVRIAKASSYNSETEFTFKLEEVIESPGPITSENWQTAITNKTPAVGAEYNIYTYSWGAGGELITGNKVAGPLLTGTDGIFKLKAGQYAEFNLPSGQTWIASEIPTEDFELDSLSAKQGVDHLSRLSGDTMLISSEALDWADTFILKATPIDSDKKWYTGEEITNDQFNVSLTSKDGSLVIPLRSSEFSIDVKNVPNTVESLSEGIATITITENITGRSFSTDVVLNLADATFYWFWSDETKTLLLSNDIAIPEGHGKITDQGAYYNLEGDTSWDVYSNWSKHNSSAEKVVILDEIQPTTTKSWFSGATKLTALDGLENLNTQSVTDMSSMFYNCSSLTSLNLSTWDTQNVTDMSLMFYNCEALTFIYANDWTGNPEINSASSVFTGCTSLPGFYSYNVGGNKCKSTIIGGYFIDLSMKEIETGPYALLFSDGALIFTDDYRLVDEEYGILMAYFTGWDTTTYTSGTQIPWYNNKSQVKSVCFERNITPVSTAYWFYGCDNLITFDGTNLDTSQVTNMYSMFIDCSDLRILSGISTWNTQNVTDMSCMFYGCDQLQTLDLSGWDTQNVIDISSMFSWCRFLQTLDLSTWDTSSVTDISLMFYSCGSLKTIYAKDWTSNSNIVSGSGVFYRSTSLPNYSSSRTDGSMCKPTTMGGYFTAP